ncbi:uncharacterized protein IWZ02DRAFT_309052 [Phyllosticta citriasiana]|uniref:uncharacterized protein n=1 Tax=Phyllosticta citriasiana TaxID=595635 RepID=UPI0030FD61D3
MGAYHSVEANQATGWLDSTPLCCCAPGYWVDHGEENRENDGNYKTRSVVSEQPRSHRQLRQQAMSKTSSMYTDRPTTRDSLRHWVGRKNVETKYWDAESFTGSIVKRQWSTRSSKSAKSRPPISNPTEFRHVDGTSNTAEQATTRRRNPSFRPLELSIYQPDFRLSPLPDFTKESWYFMPDLPRPDRTFGYVDQDDEADGSQSLVRRKPARFQSVDAFVDAMEYVGGDEEEMDYPLPRRNLRRTSSLPDTNCLTMVDMGYTGLSSRAESPVDTSGPMAVPRTRPDGSNGRVFRKFQSRQGSRPSIEQAIDELNNIVVEARAQKNGPLSPSQGHIPAIAPHLKMTHVRSETLSDIGSAFSTPYATKHMSSESELPVPDIDLDMEYEAIVANADEKARHDILVSFPQPPGAAVTSNKSTRSRLAGLLRRNAKGTADSTATPSPTEPLITSNLPRGSPFFKCEDAAKMTSSTARTVFGPNTSRYTATSFGSSLSDTSTFVTVTESDSDATSRRSMTPDTDHTTAGSDSSGSPRSIHVPVRRLGVDTALRGSHARSLTASVVIDNASKYSSSRSNSNRSDQSARRKPAIRNRPDAARAPVVHSTAAAKYTPAAPPSHAVDDGAFIGVAVSPDDEDDYIEEVPRSEPPAAYSTFDPLKSHPPVSPTESDYGYAYGYGYGYEPEELQQQRTSVVGLAF